MIGKQPSSRNGRRRSKLPKAPSEKPRDKEQSNLTDPDGGLMRKRRPREFHQCFNAQTAVDARGQPAGARRRDCPQCQRPQRVGADARSDRRRPSEQPSRRTRALKLRQLVNLTNRVGRSLRLPCDVWYAPNDLLGKCRAPMEAWPDLMRRSCFPQSSSAPAARPKSGMSHSFPGTASRSSRV